MRCQRCNSENVGGVAQCATCGAILNATCSRCGLQHDFTTDVCSSCGASLHAPDHLRQSAGERKQATVLFADIVGSTSWIAELDAEEAMERLRPILSTMAQAVRRFDGTVVRNLGDGLKAIFGAPMAQEQHALLACRAALAMSEKLSSFRSAPKIRIGVHSGEVVAGEIDTGSAIELEAVGVTVHLASRLEHLAAPGDILISRECAALVRAYCDLETFGEHSIKGFSKPIEVYRLVGLKPAIASEQFRASKLTKLRGREIELANLRRGLEDAQDGKAAVIGISASPGIGKSRLCYEFSEWCRQRHVEVLEARAVIYGHATPLQPILEMLRSFFRIVPSEDPIVAREKISAALMGFDPPLGGDVALVSDILGVGDPLNVTQRLDPIARRAKLHDIVRGVARRFGQTASVLVFEDLHWLDGASAEFIETVVDAVQGTRVLVVLNFRSSYRAQWMERSYYRDLPLAELEQLDIHAIAREFLGNDAELSDTCAEIVDRSGGNPFFAEELVRSMAESGVIVGERGRYRLGTLELQAQLPASVEAVIISRIDRLAHSEKAVIQIAAVIGKEFTRGILQEIAPLPRNDVTDAIGRLCETGIIQEHATPFGKGFSFRHPLIQEAVYAAQLRGQRAKLHAAAARAIERSEWGKQDEVAGLLAHHFEAAREPVEAAKQLQRAALWIGKTNSAEALKIWKRIRSLLRDEPRSETNDRLRQVASGQILGVGWREGMSAEEARPFAEEALRYARDGGEKMKVPLLLGGYGRILAASGAADDYVALALEALKR